MDSARTSLQEYRNNMKRTFDKGRKETEVMNGDQVYLGNDAKADSLDPRYIGPFTVVSTRPPNLTINTGSGTKIVHLNRCKVIQFQINPQNQNDHMNFELPTTRGSDVRSYQGWGCYYLVSTTHGVSQRRTSPVSLTLYNT